MRRAGAANEPPDERLYRAAQHVATSRATLRQAIQALKVGRPAEALGLLQEVERTWP